MKNAPRVIATGFALTAFATAVYAGLLAGNEARTTLALALLGMTIAYLLSLPLTAILMRVAAEHVREYAARNPLPNEDDSSSLSAAPPAQVTTTEGGVENFR